MSCTLCTTTQFKNQNLTISVLLLLGLSEFLSFSAFLQKFGFCCYCLWLLSQRSIFFFLHLNSHYLLTSPSFPGLWGHCCHVLSYTRVSSGVLGAPPFVFVATDWLTYCGFFFFQGQIIYLLFKDCKTTSEFLQHSLNVLLLIKQSIIEKTIGFQ